MTEWLKKSTAVTIKLGPFLGDTDAKTAETGLTIQKADVRLSANGANMGAANADQGAGDAGADHDELGYYDISLDTTDTTNLGRLQVMVHKAGALPVWATYMVVPANVWDSMFGADYLQTDMTQVSGGTVAAHITAIWDKTLTIGAVAYKISDLIINWASVLVGRSSKSGTTHTYKSPDNTANIVVATVDADGQRTAITLTTT